MTLSEDTCDMQQAATEAGVHYDTLRKHWRRWSDPKDREYCAFPLPFRRPPPGCKGRVAWRRAALSEWKLHRENAFGPGHAAPSPAPNGGQQAQIGRAEFAAQIKAGANRVERQRNTLLSLMERA